MSPAHHATLRFYAELNDFIDGPSTVTWRFDVPGSVKDVIEACGVPHTEVDLIIVDGESVGYDHRVRPGDRIAVYPVFESFDISSIVEVRPEPLRHTSFVADVHLGRLARHLRLLGFDTSYDQRWDDPALARISQDEGRILLTRDVGLLKRSEVTHGYYVRSEDPIEQVVEVAGRFHLEDEMEPFTRCMLCSAELEDVDRTEISDRLPARTRQAVDDYRMCTGCGEIFWRGSHHPGLQRIVDAVARRPSTS